MSVIIFDFDGTLVDSYNSLIDKFALIADKFKIKKVDPELRPRLRDLSTREILKELNIPLYKLPLLIKAVRVLFKNSMHELKPIDGMTPVFEAFHQAGNHLGIVTSNSEENVEVWLKLQDWENYFKFIRCESNYFSKHRLLRKLKKQYKNEVIWYVGDETRDVEAGKRVGIKTAAVTWGYNSEKALEKIKPDLIAYRPHDLLKIL